MAVQTAKIQNLGGSQILYNDLRKRAASADGNLADEYSASKTYAVGDFVMHLDKLYRCKTAITTAEAWTAAHWEEASMGEDVSELKSAFEQLNDNVITESAGPSPIVSIADGADGMPMRKVEVAIEPVQALHGYDAPWPAGGGKNIVVPNGFNGTVNNVNFVTNSDGSITCNGTASADIVQTVGSFTMAAGKSYIGNGCPSGGGASSYGIFFDFMGQDNGSGTVTKTPEGDTVGSAKIVIVSGYQCTNLTFKPMVRLSSSDATFAPYSNICPISGWTGAMVTRTGKNLYNGERTNGYYINVSGVIVADSASAYSDLIDAVPNTEYTLSGICTQGNAGTKRIHAYDADGNWIALVAEVKPLTNNSPFSCHGTTPNNCAFIRISYYGNETWGSVWDKNVQVELGSTATAYELYKGQTYEVTFPTEAGTVYGGTLDVVSGKLVVDLYVHVFDGTENFNDVGDGFFRVVSYPEATNRISLEDKICSVFPFYNGVLTNAPDNSWMLASLSVPQFRVNQYADNLDGFKAYVSALYSTGTPLAIGYPLKTPQEYQLAPQEIKTLLGANSIWSDAGNTAMTYPADTKLYIDNKIAELQALILENNG